MTDITITAERAKVLADLCGDGWNYVPRGEVSAALRQLADLMRENALLRESREHHGLCADCAETCRSCPPCMDIDGRIAAQRAEAER
jgi:hypothetical protein